jgi:hypothetical protein
VPGSVGRRNTARSRRDVMVTCRDCGDVLVSINRCQLRRCEDDGVHSLAYRCRSCGHCDVVGQLHPNEIMELLDAGLAIVPWQLPAEVHEPHYCGTSLTLDDLLDFHLLLDDDEWVDTLLDS